MRREAKVLTKPLKEIVIVFVSADPEPHHNVLIPTRQSTIAVSDSDRPDIADQRLEMHRGMKGIPLPESKLIPCETMNVRR